MFTWNISSINLANIDPTLCGLNGVGSSWLGSTGMAEELEPAVIPVICTEEVGAADTAVAGLTSAITWTLLSSETEFTATSLTVAWKHTLFVRIWFFQLLYTKWAI